MDINPNAPVCPQDGSALQFQDGLWHCAQCASHYRLQGLCDTCGKELEKLNACGATNWFCNHCNTLKSKSVVKYRLLSSV